MRIKLFIVTYNNKTLLDRCILSILNALVPTGDILDIIIINNHTNFSTNYPNHINVIHNNARPDFSTGHLSRNWNQCIIHGFVDLNNPDCDLLFLAQNDTEFTPDFIVKSKELIKNYNYITQGTGDELQIMTPDAVKKVGLYDERFCNIGYQEADYFIRHLLYNTDGCSINDSPHKRIHNPIDISLLIHGNLTGYQRADAFHQQSLVFHSFSEEVLYSKWNVNYDEWKMAEKCYSKQYMMYPYFESKYLKNWSESYFDYKRNIIITEPRRILPESPLFTDLFTILIQGKLHENSIRGINTNYRKFTKNIVLSHWDSDDLSLLSSINKNEINLTIIETPYIILVSEFNEGNIYRQTCTSLAGLQHISTKYVIKLRSDNWFEDLTPIFEGILYNETKMISSNLYFRPDTLYKYHFSDQYFGGNTEIILLMFKIALYRIRYNSYFLNIGAYMYSKDPILFPQILFDKYITPLQTNKKLHVLPEQLLTTSYLFGKGIQCLPENSNQTMINNFVIVPIETLGKIINKQGGDIVLYDNKTQINNILEI